MTPSVNAAGGIDSSPFRGAVYMPPLEGLLPLQNLPVADFAGKRRPEGDALQGRRDRTITDRSHRYVEIPGGRQQSDHYGATEY